ncbi:hypothetical protein BGX28_001735 [Mortierella sp. GBA30]|nr:hypothetical protein BGX28_001735 [Mortierella sp. GBA30]
MDHAQAAFRTLNPLGHENGNESFYTQAPPTTRKDVENVTGLTTQLVISIALGLAAFLMFCFLRTRWVVMFAPRTKLQRHTPPILSSTFLGWIPQLLRIPEAEMLECVGLDAVMLLRFFAMGAKLFLCFLVPGLLIILPINRYTHNDGTNRTHPPDNDTDPFSHLAWGSHEYASGKSLLYLFTQFTFTWIFTLLTVYTLWHTYEGYITIRRKFMLKRAKSITNRTVMVIGLPSQLQNDRELATFYESLGVGMVESAHVCRHVRVLKRLIEQRTHALRSLERAYVEYYGNPSGVPGYDPVKIEGENDRTMVDPHTMSEEHEGSADEGTSLLRPNAKKRPTMRLGFMGVFGKKVDKIDHCREVFATLDKAVQKMRMSRIFATTSIGFVTFEDMHSAQILAQTVNTQETLSCITSLAPEPRDVFWDNLNLPPSELGVRGVVVNTTVFFLVFFWSGPIGVFSSFLNLKSLEKLLPGVTKIAEASPIIKSLIQGFLPTLGVTVFLAVVPKILLALCERQGIQSHSAVARSLYNKYFFFILFNVVLLFTVIGTWAQAFDRVYHNLGEFALLLAMSLPGVAPFFVNFLILKGIGMFPLQLLQIGDVLEQVFRGVLSKTPRDYAEARAPPELKHGVLYSNATLAFVIVLIYSCIKPLILLFGAIYFALGHLVYKYQLLYVFFHPYESGGMTWPMVYNRVTLGLIIFQFTMLGLFMLKQSYLLGGLLTPLPVGTIWFWYWTTTSYKATAKFIPLELLRPEEIDRQMESFDSDDLSSLHYQQPHSTPGISTAALGSVAQIPGHVFINVDQTGGKQTSPSTTANGDVVMNAATAVVTPRGTLRRIPKSAVDEDDYQALPDRYTDYRQPPMTLYPGVLNSGMRQYNHPAIAGPLPTLWLPLKKGTSEGKYPALHDEESRVGGVHDSDSDMDDEHHVHEHIEAALARPPLMLPSQSSDEPQSYEQGDNLVGGGQDEDYSKPAVVISTPAPTVAAAVTSEPTAASAQGVRGPQSLPETNQAAEPVISVTPRTVTDQEPSNATSASTTAVVDAVPSVPVKKSNPAVEGINEVYYHHPERQASKSSEAPSAALIAASETPSQDAAQPVLRTVQGHGSQASLLCRNRKSANAAESSSTTPAGPSS